MHLFSYRCPTSIQGFSSLVMSLEFLPNLAKILPLSFQKVLAIRRFALSKIVQQQLETLLSFFKFTSPCSSGIALPNWPASLVKKKVLYLWWKNSSCLQCSDLSVEVVVWRLLPQSLRYSHSFFVGRDRGLISSLPPVLCWASFVPTSQHVLWEEQDSGGHWEREDLEGHWG